MELELRCGDPPCLVVAAEPRQGKREVDEIVAGVALLAQCARRDELLVLEDFLQFRLCLGVVVQMIAGVGKLRWTPSSMRFFALSCPGLTGFSASTCCKRACAALRAAGPSASGISGVVPKSSTLIGAALRSNESGGRPSIATANSLRRCATSASASRRSPRSRLEDGKGARRKRNVNRRSSPRARLLARVERHAPLRQCSRDASQSQQSQTPRRVWEAGKRLFWAMGFRDRSCR